MTNRRLASFDRGAHGAFALGGLADRATYTRATGGPPVLNCRVMVDRSMDTIGQTSGVQNIGVVVTCFAADVGARPAPGARFTIDDEVFTVDELDARTDESRYVCIVKAGY